MNYVLKIELTYNLAEVRADFIFLPIVYLFQKPYLFPNSISERPKSFSDGADVCPMLRNI